MKTALLIILCSLAALAQRIETAKLDWLLDYAGKTTNSATWDHRFAGLLDAAVPKASFYLGMSARNTPQPLRDAAMMALGGPPDDVVARDRRIVMLSACRPHSGDEKGFLWVDTRDGIVIGVVTHYFFNSDEWSGNHAMLLIYSKQVNANQLPPAFQQDLRDWIERHHLTVGVRRFVGASRAISLMPG